MLAAWKDDTPAVILDIHRQPGSNVIGVVNNINRLLPQLQATLPPGVTAEIVTDRTTSIRASVKDIAFELCAAGFLVVAVIFLFLRTTAGTLIPGIALPLSLIGTFGIMYLLGYSLDNLSLMALTIAAGFVVDDAIVMIENISRFIEQGDSPLEAALKGSQQIAFTIISLTISLVAVLIPLLFMGDVVGRLFREFSVTLGVTILFSAVVSLTLTPMLCALLLRHTPPVEKQNRFYARSQAMFDQVIAAYGRSLEWVLKHQRPVLFVFLGTMALTVILYLVMPVGFIPVQDTGLLEGFTEAPPSISFQAMTGAQKELAHAILADSAVSSLTSFVGVDGVNPTLNSGRMLINLKPPGHRKGGAVEIMRRIQRETADITGIRLFLQPVQDLTIESRLSKNQYQFSLEDPDSGELADWTSKMIGVLGAAAGIDRCVKRRAEQRPRGACRHRPAHGVAARHLRRRGRCESVRRFWTAHGLDHLHPALPVSGDPGSKTGIQRKSGKPQRPLPAGRKRNTRSPSAVVQVADTTIRAVHRAARPVPGIDDLLQPRARNLAPQGDWGDERRGQKERPSRKRQCQLPGNRRCAAISLGNELFLILAALLAVYIVLGVLYESYIHPLTILSTLPSAGVGALASLLLFRTEFTIITLIGIILLIGIVKKNGIMMVDFALQGERNEGMSPEKAIFQAAMLRFRPIMMTTLAALFAAVPLAFGGRHGIRAAASARHRDHRRAHLQPGAYALYDAGRLSLV